MKKALIAMALLTSAVFAKYIPVKEDRQFRQVCQDLIDDTSDYGTKALVTMGMMIGAVDMAKMAHSLNKKEIIKNRSRKDLVLYTCKKTIKELKTFKGDFGFRDMFYLQMNLATLKD